MIFYEVSAFLGHRIGTIILLDQYNNYNWNGIYITKIEQYNCLYE